MNKFISKVALVFALCLAFQQAGAQQVSETEVTYNKEKVNGFVGAYDVPEKDLVKIANAYFSQHINVKARKSKGFYGFSGGNWSDIPLSTGDIYYKVDGNKKKSSLIILVSKGYGNYISSSSDPDIADAITRFYTDDFNKAVNQYYLAQKIEDQKAVIAALEKEYQAQLKQEDKLNDQISNLQKEVMKNKKTYQAKDSEIEKAKQVLSGLQQQLQ